MILAGCVEQPIQLGLEPLLGADIRVAVAKLGNPNAERRILDGDTTFIWDSHIQAERPIRKSIPIITNGRKTTYGELMGEDLIPVKLHCTIELAVNASDKIKNYDWHGTSDDCIRYARALMAK